MTGRPIKALPPNCTVGKPYNTSAALQTRDRHGSASSNSDPRANFSYPSAGMSTFLDLPSEVRLKIYMFSGVVRPCPIDLTPLMTIIPTPHQTGRAEDICYYRQAQRGMVTIDHDCVCPSLPTKLLLVSRCIYDEVRTIMFGGYNFGYRWYAGSDVDLGLPIFWSLSIFEMRAMTSLLVRLKYRGCGEEHDVVDEPPCSICDNPMAQDDPVLHQNSPVGQNMIRQWTELCRYLGSRFSPGVLRLTLVCDVIDLDTGKAIVEALSALPTLNACTIRLGRQPNDDLNALARTTSQSMTGSFPEQKGFPYERLPEELRNHILSFTHIGSRGSYHDRYKLLRIQRNKLGKGDLKYLHPQICCWDCADTRTDCCCCPTVNASYSASCECRLVPIRLCLVSRTMYMDALRILYSENCFDFLQDPEATVSFLGRLPPVALKFIRRIQFRFSEGQVMRWKRNRLIQQWQVLIAFIQQNLNVPNLLIVVNLEAIRDMCLWNEDEDAGNRSVYDLYFELAAALCSLTGLCDLHFVLGWFTDLEPVLERKVMGEAYDSTKGNKYSKVSSSSTRSRCLEFPSEAPCRACRIPRWHR